jgi:hypothetical protein
MRTVSINVASTVDGNFGPVVTSATVGQTVANLGLSANIVGGSPTINSGNNIGAAFSYFSEWNYIKDSTVTGW